MLTIAELIDKFWEHAKRYYRRDGRPTGEHVVIRAAHRPLLDLYGSVPVAEFTPKHLKLVRSEMIRLDWSRRHINAQVPDHQGCSFGRSRKGSFRVLCAIRFRK